MKKAIILGSVLWLSLGLTVISADNERDSGDMDSIIEVLKENGVTYFDISDAQKGRLLVVPRFGARILAAGIGGDNLFWTHPDVMSGQGGQRSWVSPEGGAKGFIFRPDWRGNRDFSMMDPGNYRVVRGDPGKAVKLANRFQTTSNDGKERYDLTLTRDISLTDDPLKSEPDFTGVEYSFLGIDFVHSLQNHSSTTLDRILALWCLIQIPPGGTMIVPVKDVTSAAWRADYFEPIPDRYVHANGDSFSFFIDGGRRYKVGIRPEYARGVISYLYGLPGGDHGLVFMTFPVKPDLPYTDRPKTEQQTNGDAIQLYSHLEKGPLAFGELECQSWGLDLPPEGSASFPVKIYIYRGKLSALKKIGGHLVCSGFGQAYIYGQ